MLGKKPKSFGTVKVRVQLPSTDDQKAIVGGVEELLSNIEAGMATAMGNLILGEKSAMKNMAQFVSKANKESVIYTDLHKIQEYNEKLNKFIDSDKFKKTFESWSKVIQNYDINRSEFVDLFKDVNSKISPVDQTQLNQKLTEIVNAISEIKVGDSKEPSAEFVNVILSTNDKGIGVLAESLTKLGQKEIENITNIVTALNELNKINLDPLVETAKKYEEFSNAIIKTTPNLIQTAISILAIEKSSKLVKVAVDKLASIDIDTSGAEKVLNKMAEIAAEMSITFKAFEAITPLSGKLNSNINTLAKAIFKLSLLGEVSDIIEKLNIWKKINTTLNNLESLVAPKSKLRVVIGYMNTMGALTQKAEENTNAIIRTLINLVAIGYIGKLYGPKAHDRVKDTMIRLYELFEKGGYMTDVFNEMEKIRPLSDAAEKNTDAIISVFKNIGKIWLISLLYSKGKHKKVSETLGRLNQLFSPESKKHGEIAKLFNAISYIQPVNVSAISSSIDAVKEVLNKFNNPKLKESLLAATENQKELIVLFNDGFKSVREASENAVSESAKIKKNAETAIGNQKVDQKKVEESKMNAMEVMGAIALGAMIMLIGGLIIKHNPDLVKQSIKFGLALTGFLTMIMVPFALMGIIQKKWGKGAEIKGVADLVATSAIVMLIGGYIMTKKPELVEGAMKFSIALMKFLVLTMAPLALMNLIGGKGNFLKSADGVGRLIVKMSLVMLAGSLIFMMNGGKLVDKAMMFGTVMFKFLTLVMLPLGIINLIGGKGSFMTSADGVGKLIVKCTLIMLLGALFVMMGGGKFIKAALKFGLVLGAFLAVIIAPFMLLRVMGDTVAKEINNFKSLVITCTFIMMLGAVAFMLGGGKFVRNAIAFGFVIGMFVAVVCLPFLMFRVLAPVVIQQVKSFTVFLLVTTTVLMIGAYIINKRPDIVQGAIKFGVLIVGFMIGTLLPFLLFKPIIKQSMSSLRDVILFVVASTFVLLVGAHFVNKGLAVPAMKFGTILVGFMFLTILPFTMFKNQIQQAMPALLEMSIFVAISSACLLIGASFIKKYGATSTLIFASILVGFTGLMALVFDILGNFEQQIGKGAVIAGAMGISIGLLALDMMLIHQSMKDITFSEFLGFVTCVGLMTAVFAIIGIPHVALLVGLGSVVALAMGVALTAIGVAFLILHASVTKTKPWDDFKSLAKSLALAGGVFSLLGILSPLIVLGSIAATTMSIALTGLSIAFLILHVSMTMSKPWEDFTKLLWTLGLASAVFTLLGALSPLIILGSAAGVLMSVALTTLSLAFLVLNKCLSNTNPWDDFKSLAKSLALAGGVFTLLGALSPLIILGSAAGVLMSVALMTLSGAFAILHSVVDGKDLTGDIKQLGIAVAEFGIVALKLIPVGIASIAGLVGATLMLPLVVMLSSVMIAIGTAIRVAEPLINFTAKPIISGIEEFLSITDACPNIITWVSMMSSISRMSSLTTAISKMMGTLGTSIKDFANLNIPIKWDENGKPIKFRLLTQTDFTNAANGVKTVIMTLTGAIKETVDTNPWIVDSGSDFWWKLGRVKVLSIAEGEILSTLCQSLQSYAQLLIPTKWNNDGTPIKFRPMTETDFTNATNGVNLVMTTLATAISDTYTNNSNLFGWQGESIIEKVKNLAIAQGTILSTLSEGLQSYAKILIADKWNKDGVPIHFKQMSNLDFANAALNISTVMTMMASAISTVWNGGTLEMSTSNGKLSVYMGRGIKSFASGGWFGTSFDEIVNSLLPIGTLISSIAEGLQSYAALNIPVKWNKDGKPVKFREMTSKEFAKAAQNISDVLMTMCATVNIAWNGGKLTFADGSSWTVKGGIGDNLDPDEFKEIIESMTSVGDLISSVATGVSDYASSRIPVSWDKDGHANKWKQLTSADYIAAGTTISTILSTITNKVKDIYNTTFKGNDADEIKDIMEAVSKVGDLVSNTASGIKDYAELKIPTKYKDGKAVEFRQLDDTDFIMAGSNIARVVTTIVTALSSDTIKSALDDTEKFSEIIDTTSQLGSLISNISEGVKNYASGLVADRWDKDGKAIHYTRIDESDYRSAAITISSVITFMAKTLSDLNKPSSDTAWMFTADDEGTPFARIVDSTSKLGTLIKDISEGIIKFSTGMIPIAWDKDGKAINFRQLNDKDITLAKESIVTVVTTIAEALNDLVNGKTSKGNEYKWMFEADEDGSPFSRIVDSTTKLGSMIKNIAEGIQSMASGLVANQWDKNGKAIHYTKLTPTDYQLATQRIGEIISTVGKAVIDFTSAHPEYFEDSSFKDVTESIGSIGKMLSSVYDGVVNYAVLRYPIKWDKDGKPTQYAKMGPNGLTDAKTNIINVLSVMAKAVTDQKVISAINNAKDKFSIVLEGIDPVIEIVAMTSTLLENMANLKVPTGYDNDGKIKGYKQLDSTYITSASENIRLLIETIFRETNIAATTVDTYIKGNCSKEKLDEITKAIDNISNVINSVLNVIDLITSDGNDKKLKDVIDNTDWYTGVNSIVSGLATVNTSLSSNIQNLSGVDDKQISSLIEGISYGIAIISNTYKSTDKIKTIFDETNDKVDWFIKTKIDDSVSNIITEYSKILSIDFGSLLNPKNIESIVTNLLDSIGNITLLLSVVSKNIEKVYNTFGLIPKNVLTYIGSTNNSGLVFDSSNIFSSLNSVSSIIKTNFENDSLLDNVSSIEKQLYSLNLIFSKTQQTISSIVDISRSINALLNNKNLSDLVTPMFTGVKNTIDSINAMFEENIKDRNTFLANRFAGMLVLDDIFNGKTILPTLDNFNLAIAKIIESSVNATQGSEEGFLIISKGLDKIGISVAKITGQQQQKFDRNVKTVNALVTTVNKIKPQNMNALTNLVGAINLMADKLGGVDKLADSIAASLSVVLQQLVEELKHAENTIQDAKKLQEARHKLINKSIEHVKEIMKDPLTIEVCRGKDEEEEPTPNKPIDGSKDASESRQVNDDNTTVNTTKAIETKGKKPVNKPTQNK